MALLFTLGSALFLGLFTPALAAPKYGPNAVPLSLQSNQSYFKTQTAPDFWTLIPYYTQQLKGQQCSAASFTMVLNAARPVNQLDAATRLVTIDSLIEKYSDAKYGAFMKSVISLESIASHSFDGSQVANHRLTEVLNHAAQKLSIKEAKATFHEVDLAQKEKGRKAFHDALVANEKSANDFLIISFMQGTLTGDPEGVSHIAPIAAYDAKRRLVLILDPDREYYEPYWSPEDRVYDAIADKGTDPSHHGWIHFKVR